MKRSVAKRARPKPMRICVPTLPARVSAFVLHRRASVRLRRRCSEDMCEVGVSFIFSEQCIVPHGFQAAHLQTHAELRSLPSICS